MLLRSPSWAASRMFAAHPTGNAIMYPTSRSLIFSKGYATIPKPKPPRLRRYAKRSGYLVAAIGAIYTVDKVFNASAIARNCRTLWTCAIITLDYKMNFKADRSDSIPELHERVGERMYQCLTKNGGLYIKLGQAIGAQAQVLPPAVAEKFAKLFDDAPQVPYSVIKSVFLSEFGRPPSGPGGVFEVFQEEAAASASVAQVHKAKTWDGDWVAVKVQKPDVGVQMEWDLAAYKLVMYLFEYYFELPTYFLADFISDRLRQELDFVKESKNAIETSRYIANDPSLRSKVYIPKVYEELTRTRVMTAEWIDGVRLSDRKAILRLMGETPASKPMPSASDMPFTPSDDDSKAALVQTRLKGGSKFLMQTMVELFSAQMFSWGWIHCDPHPGNIIICPNPENPTYPRLVLLDHGLYVRMNDRVRKDWSHVWSAMLTADREAVRSVIQGWGIAMPDVFATMTMMRPVSLNRPGSGMTEAQRERMREFREESEYERSVRMKKILKGFLTDTDRMPKELIFILRSMRMIQGHNQTFGSPVNRIRITGDYASRSLARGRNQGPVQMLKELWRYTIFRTVMLSLDAAFAWTRAKQWINARLGILTSGFEDDLDQMMRSMARDTLGVEIGDTFAA